MPTGVLNVSLLCFEILASMWHVLMAARVVRSKRYVLCTVAGAAVMTNILIGSGEKESCSFFAPIGFVLVFVCFILLARAIRSGSNPYSLQTKQVPIELVSFHFFSICALLISTIRSNTCLNGASEKTTESMIVFADVLALVPILLTAWLKMDDALDDNDENEDIDETL